MDGSREELSAPSRPPLLRTTTLNRDQQAFGGDASPFTTHPSHSSMCWCNPLDVVLVATLTAQPVTDDPTYPPSKGPPNRLIVHPPKEEEWQGGATTKKCRQGSHGGSAKASRVNRQRARRCTFWSCLTPAVIYGTWTAWLRDPQLPTLVAEAGPANMPVALPMSCRPSEEGSSAEYSPRRR
ncbi:uncharacterized protein CLUP02_04977 [Colletotrichum lupini]|uniref:Uncharacterized protein n=1 Tax=Colletotrichum lupini TaxID=145971 RepID=A0A9Q8SLC9_9PEZI|nr:uncharacterized protein CLUP02_04977 [Colletotrichum lupini]UQC79497.1 hypothetical protein CLUP02_04977 [Colletotrichum lupini]